MVNLIGNLVEYSSNVRSNVPKLWLQTAYRKTGNLSTGFNEALRTVRAVRGFGGPAWRPGPCPDRAPARARAISRPKTAPRGPAWRPGPSPDRSPARARATFRPNTAPRGPAWRPGPSPDHPPARAKATFRPKTAPIGPAWRPGPSPDRPPARARATCRPKTVPEQTHLTDQ